ncbi:Bug family tripartite tricarboxylate transporter substrate binding protein [Achromobacter aloeverae]
MALSCWGSAAHAGEAYPGKPIYLIVPFPPGGYSDLLARLIATRMSADFGEGVIVENRPGAGGNIGADLVAKSRPDGYTLVMGTIGTQSVNPLIYSHMAYDAAKDFSPVAFVADAETVLVVNPSVPARSVADLVKLAKQKPGDMTFASGGNGTTSQLAGELFKSVDGVAINHIPYKGNVPALSDVVAGHVSMSFATLQPALPFIKEGKLIPLATLGTARAAVLPEVPTMAELGRKELTVRNWTGLLAPAGTPKDVTAKLAAEVDKILRSADVRAQMESLGLSYVKMGPDEFGKFIASETTRWSGVVRQAGITAN